MTNSVNSNNLPPLKTLYWDTLPVTVSVKNTALKASLLPSSNAKKLSEILKHCPATSLHLICRANHELSFGKSNQCQNLEHAISLLGMEVVNSQLQRMPEYQVEKHGVLYGKALKQSLYAAQLSEQFCQRNNYWQQHQDAIYFATLLQQSPMWAMWFSNPETTKSIEQIKVNNTGRISLEEQKALLGNKSLHQLFEQTSQDWKLPELCQASWEQQQYGNPQNWLSLIKELKTVDSSDALQQMESRTDKHFSIQPAAAVVISNNLSDAAHWDWYSERCLRWQEVAAACTALNLEQSIALSHQIAAQNSRFYRSDLAKMLLSHYRQEQLYQAQYTHQDQVIEKSEVKLSKAIVEPEQSFHEVETTATEPSTEKTIETIAEKKIISFAEMAQVAKPATQKPPSSDENFLIVVSRLSKQANSFNHFNAALQLVLNTLQHIGFNRSMVLNYNSTSKRVKSLFSQGIANNDSLSHLDIELRDDALLSSLSYKSMCLQTNRNNQAQIQQQMSPPFKKAVNGQAFSIISIFKGKQLQYYLYADSLTPQSDAIQSYQQFQQLGAALNQCLAQIQ